MKDEIHQLDRKKKNLIDNARGNAPTSKIGRLYIPRKEGERGLLHAEDFINLAVIGLERYVSNNNERLLTAIKATNGDSEGEYKLRKKNARCPAWKEKT